MTGLFHHQLQYSQVRNGGKEWAKMGYDSQTKTIHWLDELILNHKHKQNEELYKTKVWENPTTISAVSYDTCHTESIASGLVGDQKTLNSNVFV